ncbi:helix-turn-helix domain-containing protein [Planctomicrobium sp. SH661]|uniref:helix-turn-helix domain-containing protein n=1 Tax=Planctomicrobium sp. SH661 TaxID=3448124 RepID=UPI003F5B8836
MNLVELAQRIKELRLDRRMTLEQVAAKTSQTRSWLSKVENFRVTPSLAALGEIAAALGVPVSQLVEGLDAKPELVIVRKNDRLLVDRDGDRSNISYESLAHRRANRAMDPFLLTIRAWDTSREPLPHEGEEFLMVICGQIDLKFGDDLIQLEHGDCLYFDGNTPHCLLNPYPAPAQVLCVFYSRPRVGE